MSWYGANDTGTQFFENSVSEEPLLGRPRIQVVLDRARELLKRFALYEYKDAHPDILSGGQKQRLSLLVDCFQAVRYSSLTSSNPV